MPTNLVPGKKEGGWRGLRRKREIKFRLLPFYTWNSTPFRSHSFICRLTLTCEYLQAYDLSLSLAFLLSGRDNYTPYTKAGFQHLRFAERGHDTTWNKFGYTDDDPEMKSGG